MFSTLSFLLVFGAVFALSAKNDVERKAREEDEALQLEGEIKKDALLALTAGDDEEDFCPHQKVCDDIVSCDLTDKIYRAAWEDGIAPRSFLNIMSLSDDADDAEEWARQRKVYRSERMRTEGLIGCVYNYPRTVYGEEQREEPPRKEAAKSEEGERAWCELCGAALLSYKSKCYCYKRYHDRRRQLS